MFQKSPGNLFTVAHFCRKRADIMFVQQVAKGTDLHLQQVGCFGLVSGRLPQSLYDICAFEIVEMCREVQAVVRQVKFGVDAIGVVVRYVVGQPFRLDLGPAFESDRSLDRMLELSHIAAPHIILKQLHRLRRYRKFAATLLAELSCEMVSEIGNIFGPLTQGRQIDRDNGDTIEKVFPERSVQRHLF